MLFASIGAAADNIELLDSFKVGFPSYFYIANLHGKDPALDAENLLFLAGMLIWTLSLLPFVLTLPDPSVNIKGSFQTNFIQ